MKIVSFDTYPMRIPYDFGAPPKGFAGGDWNNLSIVAVRLEAADGNIGWGEAFSYNCADAVVSALENMLKPLVLGADIDVSNLTGFSQALQQKLHLFGRYGITMFAISGVDIALWDIAAKQAQLSLGKFINKQCTSSLEAYASLFRYQDSQIVARQCQRAVREGYTRVKLHETGLDEMRAARTSLGAVPMMLDVNCPWSEQEIETLTPALCELNPFWLEEPVFPPEDFRALARVAKSTQIPLAAGENACTDFEFQKMVEHRAVTYCQPSVTKVGGVSEFIKVAATVRKAGLQLMPHSPYFGPGFVATLQLCAALAPDSLVERFYAKPEATLYGDWINVAAGRFRVPDGPGLGVEPDLEVIREYAI